LVLIRNLYRQELGREEKAMKRWMAAGALLALTAAAATATEGPTVAMGQTLFESTALGSNGKSCASCHPAGKGLAEIAAFDDPMLKEMINFCIRDALKGKMFAPESQELDSMLLYLRTLPKK
jgi:mono/diheme cytochrome c family protein